MFKLYIGFVNLKLAWTQKLCYGGVRSKVMMDSKVRPGFPIVFLCNFSQTSNRLCIISVLLSCWKSCDLKTAARSKVMRDSETPTPDLLLVVCCNFLFVANVTRVIHDICYAGNSKIEAQILAVFGVSTLSDSGRHHHFHVTHTFATFRNVQPQNNRLGPKEALPAPEARYWPLCNCVLSGCAWS